MRLDREGHKNSRRTFIKGSVVVGTLLVAGTGGTVTWWLTQHHSYPVHTFQEAVFSIAWSTDSRQLAAITMRPTLQIWNAVNYASDHINSISNHLSSGVISWSPSGQHVAASAQDDVIQIWNTNDWSSIAHCSIEGGLVSALGWSPDGKRIVLGSSLKKAYIFQLEEHSPTKLLYTYASHSDEVSAVVWSPDGQHIVSGSLDSTVRIWNASNGTNLLTYNGHSGYPINTLAWSPNGLYIASASGPKEDNLQSGNYLVNVWHSTTGEPVYTYNGHTNYVRSLAWSPDNTQIASASDDGTVQIWHPQSDSKSYIYKGHTASVHSVIWRPDGKQLASASNDGTTQIWQPG